MLWMIPLSDGEGLYPRTHSFVDMEDEKKGGMEVLEDKITPII